MGKVVGRLVEGTSPPSTGEPQLSIHLAMPSNTASAAETAQFIVQSGGRLLLVVAVTLFVAYLLALLGAVLISSARTRMRARHRPGAARARATVTSLSRLLDEGRGHGVVTGSDDRAMSVRGC